MKLYFAPLEGSADIFTAMRRQSFSRKQISILRHLYRPAKGRRIRTKEYRDICPEHNEGIRLVPQILTNDAEAFCQTAEELARMGYAEVNLNLGCPSKTVVANAAALVSWRRRDSWMYFWGRFLKKPG